MSVCVSVRVNESERARERESARARGVRECMRARVRECGVRAGGVRECGVRECVSEHVWGCLPDLLRSL